MNNLILKYSSDIKIILWTYCVSESRYIEKYWYIVNSLNNNIGRFPEEYQLS